MFTFAGSFFSHFNHFFTIQSGIVLSHENLESQIPESMIFLITVVDEIIPKVPYIDISFRKIVLSVRFLIFDIIFTANKSLSCSQDRPNIFVSFNFTPNPIDILRSFYQSHLPILFPPLMKFKTCFMKYLYCCIF